MLKTCLFFVYLFGVYRPTGEFFTHMETLPLPSGEGLQILTYARHFWLFFSVPHLLWHGTSVYDGHFRGPGRNTHTYCWAFSSGAVNTCLFDLGLSRLGFEPPSACGANALTHYATAAVLNVYFILYLDERGWEGYITFGMLKMLAQIYFTIFDFDEF